MYTHTHTHTHTTRARRRHRRRSSLGGGGDARARARATPLLSCARLDAASASLTHPLAAHLPLARTLVRCDYSSFSVALVVWYRIYTQYFPRSSRSHNTLFPILSDARTHTYTLTLQHIQFFIYLFYILSLPRVTLLAALIRTPHHIAHDRRFLSLTHSLSRIYIYIYIILYT